MKDNIIQAAGGVVSRDTAAGREFLLVYRKRYGDWTLPKGKLNAGETPEQAALREVREETGYVTELVSFLGEVRYDVKGVPKMVRFWNMRPVGRAQKIEDTGEVKEAVWLSGDEALERMDYPREKEILTRAIQGEKDMNLLPEWIFRSTRRYRRFVQERSVFESKLASSPTWGPAARKILLDVENRTRHHDLDGAWSLLLEAKRKEIPHLEGQELKNREKIFRCEVDKVQSSWRKAAIDRLMSELAPAQTLPSRLEAAQSLLDDYYQNQYHKNSLVLGHMRDLVIIGFSALIALLTLIEWNGADLEGWGEWDWKKLLVVLLFGILGACFSATIKVTGDSAKSKIPEMAAGFGITLARTVLGATPALAAYAFLKAKILTLGSTDGADLPAALAVAFAAGFSERLVLKMLKLVDSKAGEK